MTIKFARRVAAEITGRGRSAIRISKAKLDDVSKAMTRDDIRRLIKDKAIYALKPKKNLSINSKKLKIRRSKGRGRGPGKRRGTFKARRGKVWQKKVRSQRRLLNILKAFKKIDSRTFNNFYMLVKGNSFADKASLLLHLKEKGIDITEDDMKRINEYTKNQYK